MAGRKNHMRTAEEKEAIVLEYLNGPVGYRAVAKAHGIAETLFHRWIEKYQKDGIEGLRSKTGKQPKPNAGKYDHHPSEIDRLKRELLKKEIEIERLKKGYQVKGGGAQKEFVTTFDVNAKS
ncbi:MAG: transposase [Solobacterium sp.]|nr:transposase [Solobacterium sp.]